MLQIHERIRQARVSANLTETELAEKIGVKRSTYQYWEQKTPSVDKIKLVATALGKDMDYFIAGVKDENIGSDEGKDKTISDQAYSIRILSSNNAELIKIHAKIIDKFLSSGVLDLVSESGRVKGVKRNDVEDLILDKKSTSKRGVKRRGISV